MSTKLIGIDPGLASTGVGVVIGNGLRVQDFAYGVVKTEARQAPGQRLEKIYTSLCRLFEDEQPDAIIIEDVFSLEKYPKSGIQLGKVCGAVMLAAQKIGLEVREVAVREAKQILTGNGNASKVQLEKAVRKAIGCAKPIRPYHASDALGLALIGLFRYADPQTGRRR